MLLYMIVENRNMWNGITSNDIIKNKFNLSNPSDIVWIKFTTKGHVGVVAKSFDINFDRKTGEGRPISSTVLVEE